MQMLNSSPSDHPAEKVVRWVIPISIVGAGLFFFNAVAGFLTGTFHKMTNLFTSIIGAAGAFAAMVVVVLAVGLPILYIIQNPDLVSMWWKGICRKITMGFIKLDPLSFMDAFVEKLVEKLAGLRRVKTILEGKKIKLQRKIEDLVKAIDINMKRASAAQSQGKKDTAIMLSRKAAGDTESIKLYKPMYERIVKYLVLFDKLDQSWSNSIEGTKYEVERKREEFEIIKEMHKGLSAAEIFANSDNQAVQVFQMSVKALEESVTQKIAYIDDFEKRSKSMMDGVDIENQMMDDEGLKMLEEYESRGGSLFESRQLEPGVTLSIPKKTSFASLLQK